MRLPDRLLRAGAAFLVFGVVTAALPSSVTSMTRADACNNPWKYIDPIGIGVGGFAAYELAFGHVGGGGFFWAAGKKKSDQTTQGESDWEQLHNFVNDSGPNSYNGN